MNQGQTFEQLLPSSKEPQDDWTNVFATPDSISHIPHAMAWLTQEARGESTRAVPVTSSPMHTRAMGAAIPNTLTWPSELMSQQPRTRPYAASQRAWNDDCDLLPTVLPIAVRNDLDRLPLASIVKCDASPNLSQYSAGTPFPAASSLYARSDSNVCSNSPPIRVEESLDHYQPHMLSEHKRMPLEHSMLTYRGDMNTRALSASHHSTALTFDTAVDYEDSDVRSAIESHICSHPTAGSPEDRRAKMLDERQKRGYIRKEDASCRCDQCGKLFRRSYNLKSHLATHDPHRSHPHLCAYSYCDKRFVRRIDLVRHEQSVSGAASCIHVPSRQLAYAFQVHVKARNYSCSYCSGSFSRKDTLRR